MPARIRSRFVDSEPTHQDLGDAYLTIEEAVEDGHHETLRRKGTAEVRTRDCGHSQPHLAHPASPEPFTPPHSLLKESTEHKRSAYPELRTRKRPEFRAHGSLR